MTDVIALVGKAGVGKTHLATHLAPLIGWDRLSIDTERANGQGWPTLIARLNLAKRPVIVESVAMPSDYRDALGHHHTLIIEIVCDEATRRERLAARGETVFPDRPYPERYAQHRLDTTDTDVDQAGILADLLREGRIATRQRRLRPAGRRPHGRGAKNHQSRSDLHPDRLPRKKP